MNRLHRIFTTLIIMLWAVMAAYAQEGMSIAGGLREMEKDLDARTESVRDQNNTLCALIKVVTTANNLSFDNGQLGIVRVEQKKKQSEWWVYVPEGTEKLKIAHPQYGQLNTNTEDGFTHFAPLEKATVYRLELRTPQMDELEQSNYFGFLKIESKPDGAQVSIQHYGEEIYKGTAPIQEHLHYGTYTCVVSMPGYVSESVQAILNKKEVLLEVPLRESLYDSLSDSISEKVVVMSNPDHANVTIDGKSSGKTPEEYKLVFGEHKITLSMPGYNTLDTTITVIEGIPQTLRLDLIQLQEEARPSVEVQITDDEFEKYRAEREQEELEKHRLEFEQLRQKEAQEKAEVERRAAGERLKAEKERQKAERRAERLKILSAPIQPRFEQMVLADFSWTPSDYIDAALGLNYIAGYRFNNTFFLGAGVGFLYDFTGYGGYYWSDEDYPKELGGSYYQFPLFGYLRVYFTGGKPVQFYMGAMAGYIFEPDAELEFRRVIYGDYYVCEYVPYNASSFFFSPGLGINIRTGSNFGLDVSVSYYGRNAISYSNSQQIHHRWGAGIKFNLGITF